MAKSYLSTKATKPDQQCTVELLEGTATLKYYNRKLCLFRKLARLSQAL